MRPNQHRPAPHEDMSTASIKSGVIGFPQGPNDAHAAQLSNDAFQQGPRDGPSGVRAGDQTSHVGQAASLGAGAVGAGALAEHASRGQSENAQNAPPRFDIQRQESDVPESGRSFPLSGGVDQQIPTTTTTTTNEREPGTKERNAGLSESQGREGLAGAAAAATPPSSVIPQNDGRPEVNLEPQTSTSNNPEALAAATAATSAAYGWGSHEHGGHGHRYEGEQLRSPDEPKHGLLFTDGPHVTDTANRLDPHLHIPGEYPSPTPVEESDASSYLQSKPTTQSVPSILAEPELRHTGSLEEPLSRSGDTTSQHHYGRDAAIAGGLGAAGAGAYAAGRQHEKDIDIGKETFPSEPNPYTSKQVDPRVDTVPRGGFAEQRYDPSASENRSSRNAALTGGAIGGALPIREAPKGQELQNKEYPAAGQDVKSDSQHHYGRDAALVGAGAATTAGLYASQRQNEPETGPASSTIGPHKSNVANVLDPRVQPNPDLQKHHYAAPTVEDPAPSTVGPHKSDVANVLDPRVLPDPQKQKSAPKELKESEHHYGRDAAIAGGAGAAGYGAYEAAQAYGDHRSTQPAASMNEQRYDPSAPGAHDPRVAGAQQYNTAPQNQQHHYGRDAALVGGAGALGAGAYAATRGNDGTHQSAVHDNQQPFIAQPYGQSGTGTGIGTHQRYDSAQLPQDDHTKRNAALGTAAGAGALGAGAYGLSQHDAQKEQERRLKEQQKTFDEQQKALEKKQAHDQKEHDKALASEEKKHQKEAEAKEREHAKLLQKQQHEHDKQLAAARTSQERHSKEGLRPEEEDGTPEKKHRFLTFLNKKDKDRTSSGESSPRASRDSPRHSRDYATGAGAAGVGAAAYEHEHDEGRHLGEKKGRSVLHKDPPKGHPAREADLAHHAEAGKREHFGTDGPIGDPNMISGDR